MRIETGDFMRVLVVDDNERLRRGVMAMISSDTNWEVCGEAEDGEDAILKARELLPDVILIDISMPGLNGLEVARLLRQELPQVKILIMSQHDPVHLAPRAVEAGAHAVVDKSNLDRDLLAAMDSIVEPRSYDKPRTPA